MHRFHTTTIYRHTFIGVVVIVLLLLSFSSIYFYTIQKNRQIDFVRINLEHNLIFVGAFIREALNAKDFKRAEQFLERSFNYYDEWLDLTLATPDGQILWHRTREGFAQTPSVELKHPFSTEDGKQFILRVKYDLRGHAEIFGRFAADVHFGFLLLAAALLVFGWGVVHRLLYLPLKRLGNEIKQSEERSRLLLESTSDGIYATNLEGICTICNPAAIHMLGYTQVSDMIGKQTHSLFHHTRSNGDVYPKDQCSLLGDKHTTTLVDNEVFWRADGSSFPVECRVSPIFVQGEVVGRVISFTDVSRRRETESQLRHAQKLEAVGQLAAGIAHEINTPTQFVTDNTHFLQDTFADYGRLIEAYQHALEAPTEGHRLEAVQELAKEIDVDYLRDEVPQAIAQSLEGLTRITRIVKAMKAFSHPGTAEKTATDLNRAIETTIDVSRNEWKYHAELVTELDAGLPCVAVLPGEFNQVMLNLIVNAAHTIADKVGVTGGKGEIRIGTRRDGDWVEIRVSDSGNGISEALQKRIFEPFFTTKEVGKGSGQGLAIAWSVIVDKHQGSIEVKSVEGQGTSFIIRLPLLDEDRRGSIE